MAKKTVKKDVKEVKPSIDSSVAPKSKAKEALFQVLQEKKNLLARSAVQGLREEIAELQVSYDKMS